MILSNCKIVAEGSPHKLVDDINAKSAYFGDSFNLK
jgi:lipopolysaccharide export system ATP-binding protein